MKGDGTMKYVKGILSAIVTFILGLEIGGFTMWYFTHKALTDTMRESRENKDSYYRSYAEHH